MARYHTTIKSATAIAVDTAFFYLMCPAGQGYNLRRVEAELRTVGSAGAPPDQNGVLGISLATAAGVGAPSITGTVSPANPNYPADATIAATSFATTAPTFGAAAADPWQGAASSRGGIFDNWEMPAEWQVLKGVTQGLVFVNRENALTTPLAWVLHLEWEV
ncbi:MAG TPA: hypothetical protein VK586_00890 [Streptosporangiaceae bacterium]|nr:hypothetical protein [Streptosporangiaceae bacterium]